MKSIITLFILAILSVTLLAQSDLEIVTEVDYYNATRYTGARGIARTPEGYVVVVFEPASGYTNQEIWYAIYNSLFTSWDVAQLSQSTTGSTGVPALVSDDSGYVHAAWKEKHVDGKRNAMYSKLTFIDQFTHQWSTPIIADTIDNNTGVLTIDRSSTGEACILFSIWDDGSSFDANIYCSRSTDGINWVTDNLTSVFPTPNSLPFNFMDVNLAAGLNGKMYAAWEDKPQPVTSEYEILLSEYIPGSGWTVPEINSPINDGGPQLHKYVDGCTPAPGAISVYEMGPVSYQFAGLGSTIYYDNGTSQTLSSFFNPYYIVPNDTTNKFIADVISFFGIIGSDSILVVDDDNRYNNEWVITDALDSIGVNYRVFDCGNSSGMALQVPAASDLNNKKLVIWMTGDDSNNLAYWNIADEDNPILKDYLNISGKKLWSIGRDWIYDRYGTAADTFTTGDYCYDYLGISSYDVQSWADDGNTGVEQLDLVQGTGLNVSTIDPISWGQGGLRQGEPSIASDPAGNLHMVYYDAGNGEHIFYKNYDGNTWSTPLQLDTSSDTVDVQRPNISIDANYGIYITWMEETEEQGGIKLYNVMYSTSPDGGLTWNAAQQLSNCTYLNASNYSVKNPTIGKIVQPAVSGVFNGGADVIWTEASASSSLGYYIMYARIPYVGTVDKIGDNRDNKIPYTFDLKQNYPNPFNATTVFSFSIPSQLKVVLDIFDSTGKKIDQIISGKFTAGEHSLTWNANEYASGIYYAKIKAGTYEKVVKTLLIK